nr:MAG TPA: hypothetical protein [Caudoviricetes sp.]
MDSKSAPALRTHLSSTGITPAPRRGWIIGHPKRATPLT